MTISDTDSRYHCLTVLIKNDYDLYIVSTNSFNGIVKANELGYISTKRRGNGIGIHSMKMVAKKYHGIANFYNSEDEFFCDILLKIPKISKNGQMPF